MAVTFSRGFSILGLADQVANSYPVTKTGYAHSGVVGGVRFQQLASCIEWMESRGRI